MAGEGPWISEVYGEATIDVLQEIEKQITEDGEIDSEFNGDIRYRIDGYDSGETQYGSGYGDILVIPGYYEWTEISREPYNAEGLDDD